MKRTTALLCALILCLGLFASCGNESGFLSAPKPSKNYQPTYEISVSDSSDGLGISGLRVNYKFQKKSFDNFEPPQTVKITLDGKEMTITGGKNSEYRAVEYYPVYSYILSEAQTELKIDPFGNVLNYRVKNYYSTESMPIMADKEYEQIALDFLSNFIDISELEITRSRVSSNVDGYVVHFTQYINGIKTSGHGEIIVEYDGTVSRYHAYMINQIPKDTVNPFDMDEVKAKVEAYTAEIRENKEKEYDEVNCTYDYKLTMLADGNLAIICEVEIECVNYREGGSREITGGLIELVIQ